MMEVVDIPNIEDRLMCDSFGMSEKVVAKVTLWSHNTVLINLSNWSQKPGLQDCIAEYTTKQGTIETVQLRVESVSAAKMAILYVKGLKDTDVHFKIPPLMITGAPGSGKSVLCRQLANSIATSNVRDKLVPVVMPIFQLSHGMKEQIAAEKMAKSKMFRGRRMSGGMMFGRKAKQAAKEDLLDKCWRTTMSPLRYNLLKQLRKEKRLLVILDGLDEVNPLTKIPIEDYITNTLCHELSVVVTSRAEFKVFDAEKFRNFQHLHVEPLSKEQQWEMMKERLCGLQPKPQKEVIKALDNLEYAYLTERPLLLEMFTTAFIKKATDKALMESAESEKQHEAADISRASTKKASKLAMSKFGKKKGGGLLCSAGGSRKASGAVEKGTKLWLVDDLPASIVDIHRTAIIDVLSARADWEHHGHQFLCEAPRDNFFNLVSAMAFWAQAQKEPVPYFTVERMVQIAKHGPMHHTKGASTAGQGLFGGGAACIAGMLGGGGGGKKPSNLLMGRRGSEALGVHTPEAGEEMQVLPPVLARKLWDAATPMMEVQLHKFVYERGAGTFPVLIYFPTCDHQFCFSNAQVQVYMCAEFVQERVKRAYNKMVHPQDEPLPEVSSEPEADDDDLGDDAILTRDDEDGAPPKPVGDGGMALKYAIEEVRLLVCPKGPTQIFLKDRHHLMVQLICDLIRDDPSYKAEQPEDLQEKSNLTKSPTSLRVGSPPPLYESPTALTREVQLDVETPKKSKVPRVPDSHPLLKLSDALLRVQKSRVKIFAGLRSMSSVRTLVSLLHYNHHVTVLDLPNSGLDENGILFLCKAFEARKIMCIKAINIEQNNIGEEGMFQLVRPAVLGGLPLERFNVKGNGLSSRTMRALSATFRNSKRIKEAGLKFFQCDHFKLTTKTKKLILHATKATSDVIELVCGSLMAGVAHSLEVFDMSYNDIGLNGIRALAATVVEVPLRKLTTLNITSNRFGRKGKRYLAQALWASDFVRLCRFACDQWSADLDPAPGSDTFSQFDELDLKHKMLSSSDILLLAAMIRGAGPGTAASPEEEAPATEEPVVIADGVDEAAEAALEDAARRMSLVGAAGEELKLPTVPGATPRDEHPEALPADAHTAAGEAVDGGEARIEGGIEADTEAPAVIAQEVPAEVTSTPSILVPQTDGDREPLAFESRVKAVSLRNSMVLREVNYGTGEAGSGPKWVKDMGGLVALVTAIKASKGKVNRLDLDHNEINSDALFEICKCAPSLEWLMLGFNSVTRGPPLAATKGPNGTVATGYYSSDYRYDLSGVRALSAELATNHGKRLLGLDLSSNQIGPNGLELLCRGLMGQTEQVEHQRGGRSTADKRGTPAVEEVPAVKVAVQIADGVDEVAEAALEEEGGGEEREEEGAEVDGDAQEDNDTDTDERECERVEMSDQNKLQDPSVSYFTQPLIFSPSCLEELKLCRNKLCTSGLSEDDDFDADQKLVDAEYRAISQLANAMKKYCLPNLRVLDLSINDLQSQHIKLLADAIAGGACTKMEELYLGFNNLTNFGATDKGVAALGACLGSQNGIPNLTVLDLRDCKLLWKMAVDVLDEQKEVRDKLGRS
jgi:hypothetical protein